MPDTLGLDFEAFHRLTFYALYGCLVLLAFVFIERLLFYAYVGVQARRARRQGPSAQAGLVGRAYAEYLATLRRPDASRTEVEDLSAALYLDFDERISARLWLLEAIVTAAPLLGLLGTILGIMQTFTALAEGGVSDPAAVSRGIGAALLATAVGISAALCGLVAHSLLSRQAEHLASGFKMLLLRAPRVARPGGCSGPAGVVTGLTI